MFKVEIKFVDQEFATLDKLWLGKLPRIPGIGDTVTIPQLSSGGHITLRLGDFEASRAVVTNVHQPLPYVADSGDIFEDPIEIVCTLIWLDAEQPAVNPHYHGTLKVKTVLNHGIPEE